MPQVVTVDQLCISPFNVRLNAEDAQATTALEASIAVRGLLFPLVVHDMAPYRDIALPEEPPAAWGALAGGRRLRAIRKLIAAGTLRSDFPIEVVTRDVSPAEITELSLAENLLRRQLRPYEVHAAIARAAEQGSDVDEIAAHIGQRPLWVRQQLRLGRLAPEIFAAYVEERISEQQAQAYAATEDVELQRAAWRHFKAAQDYNHTPRQIHAWLKIGDRELDRLLRFVGDAAYRNAGGRFELDLFADGPERGRVTDEGKLRELAEAKLAQLRADTRQRAGRPDLRFAAEPPQLHGSADHTLSIEPKKVGKGAAHKLELPSGDIIASIEVRENGEAKVSWWWASRKAKREAERTGTGEARASRPTTPSGKPIDAGAAFDTRVEFSAAQAARAAVKDEHGLTADGLQVMRSLRRELLRSVLCAEAFGGGTLGTDYIVWSQLRQELRSDSRPAQTGTRGLGGEWNSSDDSEPRDIVRPHLEETIAHQAWQRGLAELKLHDAFALDDQAEALTAYYRAPHAVKDMAGAVLAGLALLRSANVPGWRVAVHDRLAELAGAEDLALREMWEPTPKFMALFPKLKRLELAQPFVEPEHFRTWHKHSDAVLTGATAGALKLDPAWVHPLISFGAAGERSDEFGGMSSRAEEEAGGGSPPKPSADLQEAAE